MNRSAKITLAVIVCNFIVLVLSLRSEHGEGVVLYAALVALELFLGLIIAINPHQREFGQALMLAGGISILIGFAVCSSR